MHCAGTHHSPSPHWVVRQQQNGWPHPEQQQYQQQVVRGDDFGVVCWLDRWTTRGATAAPYTASSSSLGCCARPGPCTPFQSSARCRKPSPSPALAVPPSEASGPASSPTVRPRFATGLRRCCCCRHLFPVLETQHSRRHRRPAMKNMGDECCWTHAPD